jgi:hypothetical protein
VTKLNSTGTALVYSTFLGGYGRAYATAIAVDSAGRFYIAGNEDGLLRRLFVPDPAFPPPAAQLSLETKHSEARPNTAFIAAFDPTGAQLLYSTLFGDLNNSGVDIWGTGLAVDASGYSYLVGETMAGKLHTTAGVIQPTSAPVDSSAVYVLAYRGYVAKFNPVTSASGVSLAYATYPGGTLRI